MVDFQSRESRRRVGGDRGDDDPDESEPGEADSAGGQPDSPETTDDEAPADRGGLGTALVRVGGDGTAAAVDAVVAGLEETATVATRDRVRAEYDAVQRSVDRYAGREDVDFVVTVGGTGLEPDDVTVEALEPLLDRRLPGFGELFRRLVHDRVGSAAIGSRTTAGVAERTPVFAVPGDPEAAGLAVEAIIRPEVASLVAAATGRD